jgi:hypothetical protein
MTVSDFLGQACNKSDNIIKVVNNIIKLLTVCSKLFDNLGTSSAKTTFWETCYKL